jgi:DNA-binding NarL/FixJ family response regulator
MTPVRVVIADDQALVRAGFRMTLDAADGIEVVGEAGDGAEAVSAVRRLEPDVVLMDVRMPGTDGIEATRMIVASVGDAARIIMLTTFDVDEYVYSALRAGASGFLLKDVSPEQLVAAVRLVAAGDALLAPSIVRRLVQAVVIAYESRVVVPGAQCKRALWSTAPGSEVDQSRGPPAASRCSARSSLRVFINLPAATPRMK